MVYAFLSNACTLEEAIINCDADETLQAELMDELEYLLDLPFLNDYLALLKPVDEMVLELQVSG